MANFPAPNKVNAPSILESLPEFGEQSSTLDNELYSWYLTRKVREKVDEAWPMSLGDRIGPYSVLSSAVTRLSDLEIVELLDSAYSFVTARVRPRHIPELIRAFVPPALPDGFLWLIGVYVDDIPATQIHSDEFEEKSTRLRDEESSLPIYTFHEGEIRVSYQGSENLSNAVAYCIINPSWDSFEVTGGYQGGGVLKVYGSELPRHPMNLLGAFVTIGGDESYVASVDSPKVFSDHISNIELEQQAAYLITLDPEPAQSFGAIVDAIIYVPAIGRGSNSQTGRSIEAAVVWRATQLYFTAVNKFDDAFSARRNMWNSISPLLRQGMAPPETSEANAT